MPVQDYNVDPDLNTTISGINIAEGCAPSGINDAIRQLMADVKEESEAQAEAVAGAESAASTQVSALDSTLRAFIAQELAKYLPRSGGEMTGALTNAGTQQGAINFRLPTSKAAPGDGAQKDLVFQDSDGLRLGVLRGQLDKNGIFELQLGIPSENSYDGDWFKLSVSADGKIKADDFPVLTAAGGEMTGEIVKDSHDLVVRHATNAGQVFFRGGRDYQGGADIVLFGKEFADSWLAGTVLLLSHTHSNQTDVHVRGDGLYVAGSPVLTLVASWRSGKNWYRKWSDGWIEQGGEIGANATYTYHISFSNADYTLVTSPRTSTSGNEMTWGQASPQSLTATSFKAPAGGTGFKFYACGF